MKIGFVGLGKMGMNFEILHAKKEFDLDLQSISNLWNQGSVIRSWLLELAESAFGKEAKLDSIKGLERFRSRQDESFSAKVIAALRNEFGGHAVKSIN